MARKLINYLPEVLRSYREFQKTFEAEEPEVEKVYNELSKVLKDLFVEDATERGVKRWENILGIVPKPSESLEDRKFKILSKLVKRLPYTRRRLEQLLEVLCGENGYLLEIVEGTTNLVLNPSFENDLTNWNGWGSPPTREVVTTQKLYGSKALHLITNGDNQGVYQSFTVSLGVPYTLSVWVKVITGLPVIMAERDGAYPTAVTPAEWTGDGQWHRLTLTFTASTTTNIGIYLGKSAGGATGEYYFDAVQLEVKPFSTPFTDGIRPYNYTIKVRVALTRKNMFDDVKILLQEIIPANHIIDLSLLYNQHFTVGQYKHGELSTWTHDYIRNGVLNQ